MPVHMNDTQHTPMTRYEVKIGEFQQFVDNLAWHMPLGDPISFKVESKATILKDIY